MSIASKADAPERIHQLLADDLPRDFPPLRNTVSMLGAGITVVLADDTVLPREGARPRADSGFDVVAQSGSPDDLLRHVAMHSPAARSSTSGCHRHVTSIFVKLGLPATTEDHRRVLAVLAFVRA